MNATDRRASNRSAPRKTLPLSAVTGLAVLALALLTLRILLWRTGNANVDMRQDYLVWQSYLIVHGRWHALRQPIGMYFPAYYELTTLTSYLDGHLDRIAQIKVISFCFDIFAAIAAYKVIGRINSATGMSALQPNNWSPRSPSSPVPPSF